MSIDKTTNYEVGVYPRSILVRVLYRRLGTPVTDAKIRLERERRRGEGFRPFPREPLRARGGPKGWYLFRRLPPGRYRAVHVESPSCIADRRVRNLRKVLRPRIVKLRNPVNERPHVTYYVVPLRLTITTWVQELGADGPSGRLDQVQVTLKKYSASQRGWVPVGTIPRSAASTIIYEPIRERAYQVSATRPDDASYIYERITDDPRYLGNSIKETWKWKLVLNRRPPIQVVSGPIQVVPAPDGSIEIVRADGDLPIVSPLSVNLGQRARLKVVGRQGSLVQGHTLWVAGEIVADETGAAVTRTNETIEFYWYTVGERTIGVRATISGQSGPKGDSKTFTVEGPTATGLAARGTMQIQNGTDSLLLSGIVCSASLAGAQGYTFVLVWNVSGTAVIEIGGVPLDPQPLQTSSGRTDVPNGVFPFTLITNYSSDLLDYRAAERIILSVQLTIGLLCKPAGAGDTINVPIGSSQLLSLSSTYRYVGGSWQSS